MRTAKRQRICRKFLLLATGLSFAPLCSYAPMVARAGLGRATERLGPLEYVDPFIGTAASRNLPSMPIYVPPWGFPLGTIWIPEWLRGLPAALVAAQVSRQGKPQTLLTQTSGLSSGNTFPGASLPFGMIQWSPDTVSGSRPHYAASYIYSDHQIRGFSLNHLSGPGCPAFGDVPIMPVATGVKISPAADPQAYVANFSHSGEEASPGYYAVKLGSGVTVQTAVTNRSGLGVFGFPASTQSTVLLNVGIDSTGVRAAAARLIGDEKAEGSVSSGNFCGSHNRYTVYFVAEFNRPFSSYGAWNGARVRDGARAAEGRFSGLFVTFNTTHNRIVKMKVALSYVSVANAWLNLDRENQGWGLDAVRNAARIRWNQALSTIQLTGGSAPQKRVFYTAFYHALLEPNTFSDDNGEYLGFDKRAHHVPAGHEQYANFSGWDVYRTQIQLLSLVAGRTASDIVRSLLADEAQGGGLPIWPVANDDSCVMVGDPACPSIADAYAFGARQFDAHAALHAMVKGATQPGVRSKSCAQWPQLEEYLRRGYYDTRTKGSVSKTLEFATADFAIAQLARDLGQTHVYREFMRRAQSWENLYDSETGYLEPRSPNGRFAPNAPSLRHTAVFNPSSTDGYVEGNAAQYTWMIPYNYHALFTLMGGKDKAVKRLDEYLTHLNAGGHLPYLWIGNEPSFGDPWIYDFAREPWKTQQVVRKIELRWFSDRPQGLPGNDDLGAVSSWYVFAALGLYPEIPAVGGFCLNSPLFPAAAWHWQNGKTVRIVCSGGKPANLPFIQKVLLNGKAYHSPWLTYDSLRTGATLEFQLGKNPNKEWGTSPSDAPPSFNLAGAPHP
jgi:predicted alpha-1,2-mannosidase